jgi:hypothetical protein
MKFTSQINPAFWLAITLIILLVVPSAAQVSSPVTDLTASHQFGQQLSFSGQISPGLKIQSASLTFKLNLNGRSIVIPADLGPNGTVTAQYDTQQNNGLPAFSHLTFWFTVELEDGSQVESEAAAYRYTDNRFDWKTIDSEDRYHVSWIEGDLAFGQAVLDMVLNTQQLYDQYLDLPFPDNLQIYVYPENQILQDVLEITHTPWAAGHAVTSDNTILTAIPTGFDQQLDIQRQIPHEITHLRLAEYMGESFDQLPAWLNEGLASLAEQYTSPSYWQVLQAGKEQDSLIPFSELCRGFPADIQQAGLAYAQSDSFIRFLYAHYGKIGLQLLLDAYRMGHTCEQGVMTALDTSLVKLEAEWYREAFDAGMIPRSLSALLAWVLLLIVLLAGPIALSFASSRRRKGGN